MEYSNFHKLIFFLFLLHGLSSANIDVPCGKNVKNLSRYDVLPGGGWDNLRNMEMPRVFQPNFSSCTESINGIYVLPSDVQLLPQKQSKMEIYSELFEHYYKYRSLTATTINVQAHASIFSSASISGSFSYENQHVRTSQLNTRSITARTQLRYKLYTAILNSGMSLSPAFRNRLFYIGYYIMKNDTRIADYLADMTIVEFGTHYVTRVDAGGILWRQDFIKNYGRELSNDESTKIRASASASFCKVFSISASWSNSVDEKTVTGYENNITDSQVSSAGGIPLKPNITIGQWSDSVYTNMVPVDRAGLPLFYAINPTTLGDVSNELAGKISLSLKNAIERYYKANTVRGCMTQGSPNFNPLANIPLDDCKALRYKYSFGGVFQTCDGTSDLCNGNTVTNIITGEFTCPPNYDAVLLRERTFACRQYCHSWYIFFEECEDKCARYSIYWCSAKYRELDPKTGFLFGGLYTKRASNPLTGDKSCPASYISFDLGAGEVSFCLSRDFELGMENALDFGGFYSCYSGNPYTVLQNKSGSAVDALGLGDLRAILSSKGPSAWPHACPEGYAQHLAVIDGGCEVMYCTKAMQLAAVTAAVIQSPPFIQLPEGGVPPSVPTKDLILEVTSGSWHFDGDKGSSQKKDGEVNQLHVVIGFLGFFLAIALIASIAEFLLYRRRKQAQNNSRNRELEPLLDNVEDGSSSVAPIQA